MNTEKYFLEDTMFKLFTEQIGSVSIFDVNGRYIYVNEIWEKIQGKKFTDVKDRPVEEIVPDTQVSKVLQTGKPVLGFPVTAADNKIWVINYFPLFYQDQLSGCAMVSVFNDKSQVTQLFATIQQLTEQVNMYKKALGNLQGAKYNLDNIIGKSDSIRRVRSQITQAATSRSNVLIVGETGCGKELVAHSIHALSSRSMHPFIKVNCAAIPLELAEAELFGYDSGAFTGANKTGKKGKFEEANNGSLFLDEINQLSQTVQPKLLRALQEREIERVGGAKSIPFDVRIITATNQPLEELIADNQFRTDLYYRLNVYKIKVPPLRERIEDIPLLAEHYVQLLNNELGVMIENISEAAYDYLMEYTWPGNIRELRNVLERAMNTRLYGTLEVDDFKDILCENFPFDIKKKQFQISTKTQYQDAKNDFDKALLLSALQNCNGNKKKTAAQLGISRAMLYKKLSNYNISTTNFRTNDNT